METACDNSGTQTSAAVAADLTLFVGDFDDVMTTSLMLAVALCSVLVGV